MKVLIALFLLSAQTVLSADLNTTLLEKEDALNRIAARTEALHVGRCSKMASCISGSRACSVAACGDSFPSTKGFNCTSKYGLDSETCGASCPGMVRATADTVVRVPPGTGWTDPEVQAFTCSTTDLNTEFNKAHASGEGSLKAWAYVGHDSGAIRIHPGAPQGRSSSGCGDYDARLRPWFIAASGGPKDVILVLDRSGSMGETDVTNGETRMELLRSAVTAILGTLTQNDYVNVVQFNSDAQLLSGSHLLQATEANIKTLQEEVASMTPGGTTGFVPAFQKAMPLFLDRESSSECTRVILFLTDGTPTNGDTKSSTLAAVEAEQKALEASGTGRAHIFTFSMSSKADDEIPRAIACANSGVWAAIEDSENPLSKMNAYYQFLASGIDDSTVRWTTPYIDSFGLGQMVTAARAVYDRSNSVPVLIGVVGADITMKELKDYGTYNTIVTNLISRSRTCPRLNLTECQIQHLREKQGYRCPSPSASKATCDALAEVVNVVKCSANGDLNDYLCSAINQYTRAGSKTTAEVACCGSSECNGCSSVFSFTIAVSVLVFLCAWHLS